MTYSPRPEDLDELPMPEEWREVADVVLPGNRERAEEAGDWTVISVGMDTAIGRDPILAWRVRFDYATLLDPLVPRLRMVIDV